MLKLYIFYPMHMLYFNFFFLIKMKLCPIFCLKKSKGNYVQMSVNRILCDKSLISNNIFNNRRLIQPKRKEKKSIGGWICIWTMKYGYFKNGAGPVSNTFWVLVLLGYFCIRTSSIPKIFKKKKNHFPSFFLLDMLQK